MLRLVLAVVLATALLGASLPAAEHAERERNTELATAELERVATEAARLAAQNDPIESRYAPARTVIEVAVPQPTLTDGGRLIIECDRLVWQPVDGRNRTVDSDVPIHVASPVRISDRTRLRLSFVRIGGQAVVHVERARVEKRSRNQTARARRIAAFRRRVPV
ncbi:MAG: hypothetical protein ACI8UR_000403 [Natronomonas sp.]|uniref:DUF7311 family protein n=1 Tax=Natronomonas sp. TaxID=2184060 RepID=UPI00398A4795